MLYALLGAIVIINLIVLFKIRDLINLQNATVSGNDKLIEALERLKSKEIIEESLYLSAKALLTHSSPEVQHEDEKTLMAYLYERKLIDAITLDEYHKLYRDHQA